MFNTPNEPRDNVSRQPVTTDANGRWAKFIARIVFRALISKHLDDEQAAYDALLAKGCPEHLADHAWTAHCTRQQP